MATDKYPNRNAELPVDPKAVERARETLAPRSAGEGEAAALADQTMAGPGAEENARRLRRASAGETRAAMREGRVGERTDTRGAIEIGGPSSPSEDSPPEVSRKRKAAPAMTFEPEALYNVELSKAVEIDGRMRSPGRRYQMNGATAQAVRDSIHGAEKA